MQLDTLPKVAYVIFRRIEKSWLTGQLLMRYVINLPENSGFSLADQIFQIDPARYRV